MPTSKTIPTALIILDGWGAREPRPGNPISPATASAYFGLLKKFPHTTLKASGTAVGLFKGQEGNSEAGHLNLGAGRIVQQDAVYISDAIADGTFFKNNALRQAVHHVVKYKTAAHVFGLLSNHNSAHSCPEHLYALLDFLYRHKVGRVYLHLFTDGRDSGQHDALEHIKKLELHFRGLERIASIMGRLYGMDRNKVWSRTQAAYEAMVNGQAQFHATSAYDAITTAYNRGESDEFITPTTIYRDKEQPVTIKDNDALFFFNLRSDRARQLTKVLVQPDFDQANPGAFKRQKAPKNICFVAMTDFGPDLPEVLTAFPSRDVHNSLVATLCPRPQFYIAESEKFSHITYFFNGGYAHHFCDEEWVKVPSDVENHFERRPEMKAAEIADQLVKAIAGGKYEFLAANFANADMVGHTGDFVAAHKAVAAVDSAVDRVVKALLKAGGQGIITADHGNIEEMINDDSSVNTEHSTHDVPCVLLADSRRRAQLGVFRLAAGLALGSVAPTLLKMMGIPHPKEMVAKPLF